MTRPAARGSEAVNPERFHRIKSVLARRQPDLTVFMEKVNKPHNFSAILRNCDAVGVLRAHAVLPEKGIDLPHHTSAGTTRWVQVEVHPTVQEAVRKIRADGFRILAAHPSEEATDYGEVDFTRPTALMVGAELEGLSATGLELADGMVVIPMAGMVRSLNVSVATALLLFEAFRQRKATGMYGESRLPTEEFDRLLFEWCYPEIAEVLRRKRESYPSLSDDGEILPS